MEIFGEGMVKPTMGGYGRGGGRGSPSSANTDGHLMEHLATFKVSKETGILYPPDGMRRLLQLEKTNGIWSQKMLMRLDDRWVLILDYETGVVMERFPAALIQAPTAFTSHDPIEIYNNILVFVVGEEQRGDGPSEMHIFQCQGVSAEDLVEDLNALKAGRHRPDPPSGRSSSNAGGARIPPPPATPPPEPPANGDDAADDEASSTSSEKYGRDVTTLNHCFDDIEKFIARLQHAAAASQELEKRRKSRKSKKKDAMGDGLLAMRAKPPPENEFIDIFQKFKLSFILLAKLKHHIHDPNAPELVHFLFTPLALIVDASHDTNYEPNLPAKVVSPLLTQEAVNLLVNCVTSKETELWNSLGDAWLIPREHWKGYVPQYHPVFADGWSPSHPVLEERDDRREMDAIVGNRVAAVAKHTRKEEIRAADHEAQLREEQYHREQQREQQRESHMSHHFDSDYFDYDRSEVSPHSRYSYEGYSGDFSGGGTPVPRSTPPPPPPPRSDISADSIERSGTGGYDRAQSRWLEQLKSINAKVVQVTYPRTANNDKELSVVRGEYLQVLDDSRKWWKARNSRGEVAHVPHTIVTPMNAD